MSPKKTMALPCLILAGMIGLQAQERSVLLERFAFQDREYCIQALLTPGQTGLRLQGAADRELSAGMEGENIYLRARTAGGNVYVFWLNRRDEVTRLAYHDVQRDQSRLLPLSDFSFIGPPEIIEENGEPRGLVFLGNRSDNDDIFYFDFAAQWLAALTKTPFSEKGFTLVEEGGRLEIETQSLWARYRYRFDPGLGKSDLLEESPFPAWRKMGASAPAPAYYNTYCGFGDSITWGKIDGQQQPQQCFLAQMQDLLADPAYDHYYGASYYANLGVPSDTTMTGVRRIEQDLDLHPGFYFLLMLGANDIIDMNLSTQSSLENLGFIIDAAKARGMRVIVSTVTPSKSIFSIYEYFWKNLSRLNAGILDLAEEKEVAHIDTYAAFMNSDPPDGWEDLLEEYILGAGSGTHPNEAGHALIASLFAAALVQFPPQAPEKVTVIDPGNALQRTASWSPCYESDFSHFHIEFDFLPGRFTYSLDTTAAHCTFTLFPFLPRLFFRIQTVDRGERQSAFSSQGTASPDLEPATQPLPPGRPDVQRID